MVLVMIVQVVSPFWKYWLCVVTVLVTLQELSPNAERIAVATAIMVESTTLIIRFALSLILLNVR